MAHEPDPDHQAAPSQADPSLDELFHHVYGELRRIAHRARGRRGDDTLNTTALVHEAYLKLTSSRALRVSDRTHFLAVAARAMRQILVDNARWQLAGKRAGGAIAVTFDDLLHPGPVRPDELVALDEALARLDRLDRRRAQVVEHRIFGGLTMEETAVVLGVSRPTVERDWRAARAWLLVELEGGA